MNWVRNSGRIDHILQFFVLFLSPCRYHDSNLKWATTASFDILSNALFTVIQRFEFYILSRWQLRVTENKQLYITTETNLPFTRFTPLVSTGIAWLLLLLVKYVKCLIPIITHTFILELQKRDGRNPCAGEDQQQL
jgi:hypothetical protein